MALSSLQVLFSAPETNPINSKAKSIPILNPFDKYGRVFFFSWLGFMVAFLSWYAFPPLLTVSIREDLNMTQTEVANSNIVSLLATFLVRIVCGPLCDKFGPRWVFIGTLLIGAVPTAMAGLAKDANGLMAVRFFVGILGGAFVPCQVWCTAFFDKSVIGTANGLSAGWGTAGGGITYFVMPAVFESLVRRQGLTPHVAWRVAYVVPFVIIVSIALGMLFLCDDTPTGKWAERGQAALKSHGEEGTETCSSMQSPSPSPLMSNRPSAEFEKKGDVSTRITAIDAEAQRPQHQTEAKCEVIVEPTVKESLAVLFSKESLALAGPYAASFGSQLAVNAILGSYYYRLFPDLGQDGSGDWAAICGLLNVIFRPIGGVIADVIYKSTNSVQAKGLWLTFNNVAFSTILIALGFAQPQSRSMVFGLVSLYALLMEIATGATFAIVPHVHPSANGIVSGLVGAVGNLGGIIFAIIFRYNGTDYNRSIWIIGVISMVLSVAPCWVRLTPKPKTVQST